MEYCVLVPLQSSVNPLTEGVSLNAIVMSSEAAQLPFISDQRNTYGPGKLTVTVVAGFEFWLKFEVPVPDIWVHVPPKLLLFTCKSIVCPQIELSGPASGAGF